MLAPLPLAWLAHLLCTIPWLHNILLDLELSTCAWDIVNFHLFNNALCHPSPMCRWFTVFHMSQWWLVARHLLGVSISSSVKLSPPLSLPAVGMVPGPLWSPGSFSCKTAISRWQGVHGAGARWFHSLFRLGPCDVWPGGLAPAATMCFPSNFRLVWWTALADKW